MPRAVFSPDGQLAAFSSGTWQTYEWNSRKPGLAFELQGFMHYPRILLSPDGRMLASFSEEEARIALWDVNSISMEKTIQPIRFLTGYYNSILSMAFSPDSQYLATSSYEDKVVVWNTADSGVAAQLVGHGDTINQVEFSPDGRWLASASSDMTIRLWKTGTWETVTELRAEAYPVEGIRFSPDGRYLASWNSFDGTHVWRLSDFERAFDYGPGYDPVFSPNGEKIAFETEESKVLVVRNIADGSEYNLNCRNPLFTPDSALLACANESGQVILYTADGVYLRTLEGWTDTPFLFSSDGRLLVGVSGSQIIVWTVTDGTLVATWDGHHQYVFQLTISPDNTFIVSSSFDGTIRLWGLPSP